MYKWEYRLQLGEPRKIFLLQFLFHLRNAYRDDTKRQWNVDDYKGLIVKMRS